MQLNKYLFQDLKEHMEYTFTRQISQNDINIFCKLTDDFHPLHTDIAYSRKHGFDNVLVHGLLLSSLSSMIIGMKLPGENALIISEQFSYYKPVYVGDLITINGIVAKIDQRFQIIDVKIKIKKENILVSDGLIRVKVRN
jgi:3-hydroxybutyryl-CoA dehydratase